MYDNTKINISQCQNALKKCGYFITKISLPSVLSSLIQAEDYQAVDELFLDMAAPSGQLFETLSSLVPNCERIEHIISLRDAANDWEEDGIWHDDGSRVLAFSLSLTLDTPKGGVLELRKKGDSESSKIPTPAYGNIIIFHTGENGYEHKINQVTKGKRLIIAGWCYPSKSISDL